MVWADDLDNAVRMLDQAQALGSVDPTFFVVLTMGGAAHLFSGRPEVAVGMFERAAALNPNFDSIYWCLCTAYTQLGRMTEAQAAAAKYMTLAPDSTISKLTKGLPIRNPAHVAMVMEALRAAGLPE